MLDFSANDEAEQKLKQQLRTAVRERLQTVLRGEVLGGAVQVKKSHLVESDRNSQQKAYGFLALCRASDQGVMYE